MSIRNMNNRKRIALFVFVVFLICGLFLPILGQDKDCATLYPVPYGQLAKPPFGFIDCEGTIVVPLKFDRVFDFNDGVAVAVMGENSYLFYKNDKPRTIHGIVLLTRFSEGLAIGRKKERLVLVNQKGKTIAPLPNDIAKTYDYGFIEELKEGFSNGLAKVDSVESYRFINKKGKYAFTHKFGSVSQFQGGITSGSLLNGEDVIINTKGKIILSSKYTDLNAFHPPSDGLVSMRKGKWKWEETEYSYVNNLGRNVLSVQYQSAQGFSEGFAPVFDGKKWGYIDKSGKVVIPFRFNGALGFSEGLAEVLVMVYKRAFIDKFGNYVIPPSEFTTLGINPKFKNGLVYVTKNEDGKQYEGYINRKGNWVWKKRLN